MKQRWAPLYTLVLYKRGKKLHHSHIVDEEEGYILVIYQLSSFSIFSWWKKAAIFF